jgi:thiol-disulfide isomerase/thioredoxin
MKKYKTGPEFSAELTDAETTAVFYMGYCPFCMRFCPQFEKKFEKKSNCVMVALDSDDDPLWEEYKIKAVPTVLVFKNKKIVKRYDAIPGVGLDINKI